MRQNWYFIFSESSVFRKRYIKFYGTREECAVKQKNWHLERFVNEVLSEQDFKVSRFFTEEYKELDIESE
jgi:hypothetical protein